MKYLITAGGTGGHIYPAVAMINKIKEMDSKAEFLYIGTTDRMEKDIIPNLGIDYNGIKIKGLSKNPFKLTSFSYYMLSGISKCKKIIKKFKPDIVLAFGGYVTVPVVIAAKKQDIKVLLHEQNSIPGKANILLSKYSDVICASMPSTLNHFKDKNIVFTGNPRAEEATIAKKGNKLKYGLTNSKKLVIITTGSLGAKTVNDCLINSIDKFKDKNYEVLIVAGKNNYEDMKKVSHSLNVKIVPYLDDMLNMLRVTDLVVTRSGASIISEIMTLNIPSILIPSPYVANNHQYLNAKDLSDKDAAVLLEEKDLTSDSLIKEIDLLLNDKEKYKSLLENTKLFATPDSATKIYNELQKILK